MADDEEDEREVEFIDAKTDAEYRLQCISAALQTNGATSDAETILETAQQYYDWIMDSEAQEEPGANTPEDACTPRRH